MCNIIASSKFLLIYDEVRSFYENPWKLKSIQCQSNDAQNVSSSSSNDLPACVKISASSPCHEVKYHLSYQGRPSPEQTGESIS